MSKVNFWIFNSFKETLKIPKITQIRQKYIFLDFFQFVFEKEGKKSSYDTLSLSQWDIQHVDPLHSPLNTQRQLEFLKETWQNDMKSRHEKTHSLTLWRSNSLY